MMRPVTRKDVFGLIKPAIDAHTLGIVSVGELIRSCGIRVVIADKKICEAANRPSRADNMALIERWIREEGITRLGFSYRLDPREGAEIFGSLVSQLMERRLLAGQGGPILSLYFAGLPDGCDIVRREHGKMVETFCGDEGPGETLEKLGIGSLSIPSEVRDGIGYDEARLDFARDLIRSGKHLYIRPVDRSGYEGFGTKRDRVIARIGHSIRKGLPPLMRAHLGPYLPDRKEALRLFLEWAGQLARDGFLDILSIGTSQLSQSNFGEDWGDKPNGGGVPINSPEEFRAVWDVSRPMLVRTYAGTKDIPKLARIYEETINMAWHALSFWWFCKIDGRGPYSVMENLEQHMETLKFIAGVGKPFEPNIPHQFAFRGADDLTYIVSAFLAAKTAKSLGIRYLILQNMLNTPKYTWGVQDLAKSRAMLSLVRELEDGGFRVFLQPRAGLDYLSKDPERAKVQLAAVSALMDDIEPWDPTSPPIIHVVSYSEGFRLADPSTVNESIRITRAAIEEYRRLRRKGDVDDMSRHPEVMRRTEELLEGARTILSAIESALPNPYTAEGLYRIFWAGFMPVPYLWECRDEFENAVRWRTMPVKGGVKVVDEAGIPIPPEERARMAVEAINAEKGGRSG
jgi:hypothetical protein